MMWLDCCLQLTAEILVKCVIFADITLEICMDLAIMCDMPATLVGVSPWHRSLMVVLSPIFCIY
jgi:hypothetical protein